MKSKHPSQPNNQPYNLYRAVPKLRTPGTSKCRCGKVISANKGACAKCGGSQ